MGVPLSNRRSRADLDAAWRRAPGSRSAPPTCAAISMRIGFTHLIGFSVGRLLGGSVLEAVPGPARDAQAFGYVVGGVVVGKHGCGGGPGEVVVQHLPQRLLGEADVCQRLVKASDRALVHFLVRA